MYHETRTHSLKTLGSLALLGALVAGWNQTVAAATVTRGPYLQMGTPTSTVVRWRTDSATDSRVRYGNAPASLTSFAGNATVTTEHEVNVSGLSPDTQYYYSVGTSTATLAGGDSTYFWITFPPTGVAEPTRVWVLGDSGTANASAAAVRDAYFNATGTRHTDLWLMLGDNAYDSGLDSEYQSAVFNLYPTMLRKSVLFPALGNHDTAQSTQFVDTYPYFAIFTLPKNGECGGLASGTEHYYSFDCGNLHFICLDSMTANRSAGGAMAAWVRNDLATTTRDWVVAYWHHPPYSKGSHNSDAEIELIEMRQNFLPILEAGGVDLVLAGHSHAYERSYLIDSHYDGSTTFNSTNLVDGGSGRDPMPYQKPAGLSAHNGAVYAVAGSSGQISGGSLNHPAMFISLNLLGSVVLDFTTNRLDLQFLDSTGVVRDNFAIIKAASIPPAAPTGLAVTAGNNQVDLTWNASSGAVSYNVKRATVSGGPYATVATGVTAASFTDTTAVNGTTYFYVVTAVNAVGESSNSNEASARPQPPSPPNPPTALTARATGKKKVNLTWTQSNSPNVTQNKIYRATVNGGPYNLVATIAAATSFNNTGLTSGTTYYYVVTAVNAGGLESAGSNQASATAR
jgi:Calcineurin-like phosphoesterase/Purple acid Phosphatase, N-terminal domain/Fibronectin type III domain